MRRVTLLTAGALVCIYAVAVLVYAHSTRETGFRTAFDTVVRGFDGEFQSIETGLRPEPGDRIVRLGNSKVETWSHFLRSVRGLPAESSAFWQETAELPRSSASDGVYRRVGGDDWVFTQLERPNVTGAPAIQYAGWTKVGALPIRELIPSI